MDAVSNMPHNQRTHIIGARKKAGLQSACYFACHSAHTPAMACTGIKPFGSPMKKFGRWVGQLNIFSSIERRLSAGRVDFREESL